MKKYRHIKNLIIDHLIIFIIHELYKFEQELKVFQTVRIHTYFFEKFNNYLKFSFSNTGYYY